MEQIRNIRALAHDIPLAALREAVAVLERGASRGGFDAFDFGVSSLDQELGEGLSGGALHEIYAQRAQDDAAATGFGLGLALRAAGTRSIIWVRHDFAAIETGELSGDGLAAFGLDPKHLLLVRPRDPTDALRAASEAGRCPAAGAVIIEIRGEPKALDMKANQRLALAARTSGVTFVTIRLDAKPAPSAAASRWSIAAAASAPLEANAPGRPAFLATLLRHRSSLAGRSWRLEWDRDRTSFCESAPLSRLVAPIPASRPSATRDAASWRRAG